MFSIFLLFTGLLNSSANDSKALEPWCQIRNQSFQVSSGEVVGVQSTSWELREWYLSGSLKSQTHIDDHRFSQTRYFPNNKREQTYTTEFSGSDMSHSLVSIEKYFYSGPRLSRVERRSIEGDLLESTSYQWDVAGQPTKEVHFIAPDFLEIISYEYQNDFRIETSSHGAGNEQGFSGLVDMIVDKFSSDGLLLSEEYIVKNSVNDSGRIYARKSFEYRHEPDAEYFQKEISSEFLDSNPPETIVSFYDQNSRHLSTARLMANGDLKTFIRSKYIEKKDGDSRLIYSETLKYNVDDEVEKLTNRLVKENSYGPHGLTSTRIKEYNGDGILIGSHEQNFNYCK